MRSLLVLLSLSSLLFAACSGGGDETQPDAEPPTEAVVVSPAAELRARAGVLGVLPGEATSVDNPVTDAKITLGSALYHDPRLSKADDVSCATCHDLAAGGVDGKPTSTGHEGQVGGRNAPTVYNAGLHLAQFWDGRAPTLEEQAKGPVLNPIEMAMPDEAAVVAKLKGIEGYAPLFAAAFPDVDDPITYQHMAMAIGAFERRLMTPGPLDAFLGGDDGALSEAEQQGLALFLDVGCASCHSGPAVGGGSYQKLGAVRAYETADEGRFAVTGDEGDKFVFKVPGLRNIAQSGPYFHDGAVATLDDAILLMAAHQLGRDLEVAEVASIRVFLEALTGTIDEAYIAAPALP